MDESEDTAGVRSTPIEFVEIDTVSVFSDFNLVEPELGGFTGEFIVGENIDFNNVNNDIVTISFDDIGTELDTFETPVCPVDGYADVDTVCRPRGKLCFVALLV